MSVKSRNYFSVPYLCGAARYAREAAELESNPTPNDETALVHRAYVISAITSSAAALEAMINEVFSDAAEPEGSCIASLSSEVRAKLATLWSVPRTSSYAILDKFDVAHLLVTGQGLDRSNHRWEHASWVVRLRNDFVHYQPSWQEHGVSVQESASKAERALAKLFQSNRLAGTANPFYPDRLLGHGCAAWSVASALEFADYFWKSIGVAPPYQAYRHLFITQ
ncbi:MAG: hypothetical protein AB1761_13250 [Pseudomonadota bacterium]